MSLFWKQNDSHITSLMPNRRVIISKRPYISLMIAFRATKYENYLYPGFSILLMTEVVPKIFLNLNVVGHLAVPAGRGSCLPRLAIFLFLC